MDETFRWVLVEERSGSHYYINKDDEIVAGVSRVAELLTHSLWGIDGTDRRFLSLAGAKRAVEAAYV